MNVTKILCRSTRALWVALCLMAAVSAAKADQNPPGCGTSAVGGSLTIFFADGVTPVAGGTVTTCETIVIQGSVNAGAAGTCCISDGTIQLLDGNTLAVIADITPVGGVPLLCDGASVATLKYTNTVSASGSYILKYSGIAHVSATDVLGSAQVLIPKSVTPVPCTGDDPCAPVTCDPTLVFGAFGERLGGCVTNAVVCDDPCSPCVGGVCTPVSCPDPCSPCVGGVCTPVSCPDPCSPCVGGVCTPVSCPDPCSPCVGGVCTPVNCPDPCFPCDPTTGACATTSICNNNGCTPGFWKNCTTQWCGTYTTSQKVSTVFTIPSCVDTPNLSNKSLLQALAFQGGSTLNGGAQILLRAGVAALLNACKGIGYPLTTQQITDQVNTALASCDRATIIALATTLDANNNLGCKDSNGNSLPCKPK